MIEKIKENWQKILLILKEEHDISDISYHTWLEPLVPYSFDNNTVTVIVPEQTFLKFVNKKYGLILKVTISEFIGRECEIQFKVKEQVAEAEPKGPQLITKTKAAVSPDAIQSANLNPKYTFDSFVVGSNNNLAHAAALAVAESPGEIYNPLFIYLGVGLKKTHLMHAIGNYIMATSNKKVLYVTSEKFVDDFLNIYRKNETSNFKAVDNFKRKYRDIDVLMIDDIQYLEIASKTQQEFFNTFNELHTQNKQIIISSDRSPDDLKKLEERLRTRFNWGLTIDILPPDFELRMAILNKKIESQGIGSYVPEEVKEYIVGNCTTDIRKLEGALTRVFAYATIMNGSEITLDLAVEALKDYIGKNIISRNKIDQVIQLVANNYNITVEDIKSKKRLSKIAVPRQIGMYICREHLKESLPKIGSEFGGKDHTTVMHSVAKIKRELKKDKTLEVEISKIINQIK